MRGGEPIAAVRAPDESLVQLLQERTGDGYVLRVDLRLRPDPGSTAVAISLPAAFSYYETLGQNWERAALIKARPDGRRHSAGAAVSSPICPLSSGANISITRRSPTFMR